MTRPPHRSRKLALAMWRTKYASRRNGGRTGRRA